MKSTIKFINADLTTGIATLMVGSKFVDITSTAYQALQRLSQAWDSGLEKVSKVNRRSVFKFNSETARNHGAARFIISILTGATVLDNSNNL